MMFAAIGKLSAASAIAIALLSVPSLSQAETATATAMGLEPEQSDVATLSAPKPGWIFVNRGFVESGTSIYDSATGKMLGMVETSLLADMAIDPAGKYYYVAETIWTKGWRGTRQDMVTIYDSAGLKLQSEIPIPGRILIGARRNNFVLSDDGKTAFVYNLSPASSVNMVDLAKRKFVRNIELPGCASLIPNPGVGFSALCSDGTIATVATGGAKPVTTRSAPFFSATDDPIFDNFAYDKATHQAVFLTYTGQIYTARMGASPTVSAPFSLQAAAGVRPGETKPLDTNWYPGGDQQLALHRASGHLYVLMHMGEYWSHKAPGTEIWDLDLAAKKVVKRVKLEDPASGIEVTQQAEPSVILSDKKGTVRILDVKTWAEKFKLEKAGSGLVVVADPS
jgi:methylamine dehydrogenase heavy chain